MSRRFIQFIPISYNRKSVLINIGNLEIAISHEYLASIKHKKFVHFRNLKPAPKHARHCNKQDIVHGAKNILYTKHSAKNILYTKHSLYTKHNSMQNTLDNQPYWLP